MKRQTGNQILLRDDQSRDTAFVDSQWSDQLFANNLAIFWLEHLLVCDIVGDLLVGLVAVIDLHFGDYNINSFQ